MTVKLNVEKTAGNVVPAAELMPEIDEITGVDAETLARMPRAEIERFVLKAAEMVRHLTNQVGPR